MSVKNGHGFFISFMDVIILAGGLGTRLRSVVKDVPKCMAPVGGKPFLWYLLHQLSNYNIGHVVLSVGYLREVIFEWIEQSGIEWPFSIDYAIEEQPLGTGGGIRLALSKCVDNEVLILNGDTFFNVDLSSFLSKHRKSSLPMSVALKPMKDFDRYGNVTCVDNVITEFHEKQPCAEGLINGGVYLVNRNQLSLDSLPQKFSFETEVLQPMSLQRQISGFAFKDYFIDIGIPEDYNTADVLFPDMFKSIEDIDVSGFDTIFVDRDGTMNTHILADYVRSWNEFSFLPGVLDAFAKWKKLGKRVVVVTNQRGVGRGLMSMAQLDEIHARMNEQIEKNGGHVDAVYCSVGVDNSDPDRKPATGMFMRAQTDFPSISADASLMIGDSDSDMQFAENCKMKGIRLY